ncbi:MAG: type II toxin-antitoxin system RelE/ParE family toxin [Candidatus Aenigmarchaeota archaeon]|nr:type II toxin-antitoxin system RelE/ParE family toxin [Candidatus Aenigmarchaeota archaeon]
MYEILFSESAERQLKALDPVIRKRVIHTLERIRIRPEFYVKKLVGDPGYRLRVGDYRIIMDIDKNRLLILVILEKA